MMDEQDQGILFIEQVINLKWHRHTVIECIPVPRNFYELAPAYFKEALLIVEGEWSQHKKVIDTEKGFRKSLVSALPYFHVWFDHKRGYGHVIEDPDNWEPWFGKQVIANVLDIPIEKWRRPRKATRSDLKIKEFKRSWAEFDWTKMLDEQA